MRTSMLSVVSRMLGLGSQSRVSYPGIPDGVVLYVIGDIHGCLAPLKRTLAAIDRDLAATRPRYAGEVFLGDYVDRGPDSLGVIDLLLRRGTERKTIFVKGNHDAMMEEFVRGERALADWLPYGGADTLRSYGATPEMISSNAAELAGLVPPAHLAFLSGCEYFFEVEDYIFVHAGVRPGRALHEQSPQDLMWIREDFLKHRGSYGAIIVHGHTPVAEPEFRESRIGIDTGAYMTGRLTCLRIDAGGPRVLDVEATEP